LLLLQELLVVLLALEASYGLSLGARPPAGHGAHLRSLRMLLALNRRGWGFRDLLPPRRILGFPEPLSQEPVFLQQLIFGRGTGEAGNEQVVGR
jgi:hypothetical protein